MMTTGGPTLEQWRRTRIVATVGPSCDDREILRQMILAGMDVARLNLSHGAIEDHYQRVDMIRSLEQETGRVVSIMADLCGPKIRIGQFKEEPVTLHEGQQFTITTEEGVLGDENHVGCVYDTLHEDVRPGSRIYLADGLIRMDVEKVEGREVVCRVQNSGVLTGGKGLNLPGTALSTPSLTEKDRKDLDGILNADIDYLALSFVRSPEAVLELKQIIASRNRRIKVVAKIEKPEALTSIEEILDVSDAVMVARGDLGVETSVEAMPVLQKQLIRQANIKGVPVITATQMLESMITHQRPTRAEASDVANAILDGTDALMLSGETASGSYPVESVRTMARIAEVTEPQVSRWKERTINEPEIKDQAGAIALAVSKVSERLNSRAICAFTRSGYSAGMISRHRPPVPIIALTPDEKVIHWINLCWGIFPSKCPLKEDLGQVIEGAQEIIAEKKLLPQGSVVCLVAGLPGAVHGVTNTLHLMRVRGEAPHPGGDADYPEL
ncbi:MAG: pyruvate kinase [Candidatus Omnitrophica bacterium]|nr:pyruvate kinase [Candidatus Omnitrophota bacterium]